MERLITLPKRKPNTDYWIAVDKAGDKALGRINLGDLLNSLQSTTSTSTISGDNTISVTQTGHGLGKDDAIRHNGSDYVKAIADSTENAEVIGVVVDVPDTDHFTYQFIGLYTGSSSTWTAGQVYFLSATTAGLLTTTEPTANGHVRQVVGMGEPNNSLLINIGPGHVISGLGPEGGETKSISIYGPSDSEDIAMFYVPDYLVLSQITAVVKGTSSPSVTIDPEFTTDRSSSGTKILSSPVAITNTTTGQEITTFANDTISAGNWIVIKTTATSGIVNEITITIEFTEITVIVKSITVQGVTASEDIAIFRTANDIEITNIHAVIRGTSTPSVTINPVQAVDRSSAGTAILSSPTAITDTTTGQNLTSFNDATVPANSWVLLKTTAKSGTVDELTVTIVYNVY